MPVDIVGKELRIKVAVSTQADLHTTSENVLIVIVSDNPSKPAVGPQSITSITTTDRIGLSVPIGGDSFDDGGSPITGVEV